MNAGIVAHAALETNSIFIDRVDREGPLIVVARRISVQKEARYGSPLEIDDYGDVCSVFFLRVMSNTFFWNLSGRYGA